MAMALFASMDLFSFIVFREYHPLSVARHEGLCVHALCYLCFCLSLSR